MWWSWWVQAILLVHPHSCHTPVVRLILPAILLAAAWPKATSSWFRSSRAPSWLPLLPSSPPPVCVQAKENFQLELEQLRCYTRFGIGKDPREPTGALQKVGMLLPSLDPPLFALSRRRRFPHPPSRHDRPFPWPWTNLSPTIPRQRHQSAQL